MWRMLPRAGRDLAPHVVLTNGHQLEYGMRDLGIANPSINPSVNESFTYTDALVRANTPAQDILAVTREIIVERGYAR